MLRTVIATLGLAVVLSGAALAFGTPRHDGRAQEERVNANLLRVQVNGHWESFPMVALAEHLCDSGDAMFERYCNDQLLAPTPDAAR
ncbi:MAG: hypothetical protein AAB426_03675 [Myxococcota bacterium]